MRDFEIELTWLNADCFTCISFSVGVRAKALTLPIEGRIQVPGNSIPVGNQEITLNGDQYSSLTKIDGSFTFYDVPTGTVCCCSLSYRSNKLPIIFTFV